MDFKDKIVVIGDSQVRAFSFNKHFIPFFIGPAALNNFLTEESCEEVCNKVTELLSRMKNEKLKVLLFLNGDVILTERHSEGYSDKESSDLKIAVERYTNCISRIKERFPNISLSVSAVIPGRTELFSRYLNEYNHALNEFCTEKHINFININEKIAADNILENPYQADFAHVNYRIARFYVKNLIEKSYLSENASDISDYRWSYTYEFQLDSGSFKLWGDIYRDQLTKKDFEFLPLKEFPKPSNALVASIPKITETCISELGVTSFTVANCAEGFLAYVISKKLEKHNVDINGFDMDPLKIENAELLKNFKGNYDIDFNFISLKDVENNEYNFDYNEVVVDYCQYQYKEPVRLKLLSAYNNYSKYLFLLSNNVASDTRLLNKSGYTDIVTLTSVGDSNSLLFVTSSNQSENN